MKPFSRRDFFGGTSLVLASLGASDLAHVHAQPTEGAGNLEEYAAALKDFSALEAPAKWTATDDNAEGPNFRRNAPFRAKITPPSEPGTILLIGGRVWNLSNRTPLRNALLDIWQADAQGRFDNDDPRKPLTKDAILNRARLLTDETGWYEFETIKPGPRKKDATTLLPSAIHFRVMYPGCRLLVTRLFFRGDPHQENDLFFKPSLAIELKEHKTSSATFKSGRFDIVLEAAA